MRRNWITILPLVLLVSFMNNSNAQEIKEITCTGKVINAESQPITDVKVSLYEYDSKLAAEVTTEADGAFSFSISAESDSYRYGYIVAEKEGRALGCGNWDMKKDKALEIKLGQAKELAGVVVDQSDEPVSGAQVSISMLLIGEGEEQRRLSGPVATQLLTLITDTAGKFAFTGIPAEATAEFLVKKTGRATVSTQRTRYAGQKLQFAPGQTDIKLVSPVEAKIEGIVVEKNTGKPIGGVKVMAMQDWNRPLFGQEPISSKEDGTFGINALVGGKHMLQLGQSREGLADWVAEPVEVITEAGKTKSGVKVELSKGGLLEVVVTEAVSKQPLEKASVSIRNARSNQRLSAISDEDGVARIRLMPGGYQISGIYKQGFTRNRRQETITIGDGKTIHIDWQLSSLPKITGVVRDEKDKPLEGVKLKVCPAGWQDISSDVEGKYEVSWDPGRWGERETIFCLLARHKQRNLAAVEDIGEETKRLDIKLKSGVIFAGKVVDPDGKGIADARIMIYLQGPGWGSPIGSSIIGRDQAKTDAQGKFEIKAVPMEHTYSIYASAEGYGDKRIVTIQTEDAVDNHLDVGTLTLPVANLSVSGQVVDTQGRPIAHARIESSGFGKGQPDRLTTQTDKEGNFRLEGVCAGRVDIRVNVDRDGKRLSARVFTDGGATGIKIVVREGRSVVQDLGSKTYEQIIQSAGKVIAGIAVDENGSPVADVPVRVCCHKKKREDGRFVWMYGYTDHLGDTTDKEGHFAIELEEDGEYNLRFSPDKHAAIIAYDVPVGKKDLKVTLSEGGTVTGRLVRMEKGKKVPIPNAEVKAEQTSRSAYTYLGFDRDRTTVTDSQGRFRFEHLRTKIRLSDSMTAKQWKHTPRVWEISFGDTSKTIAFYDGTTIEDFELVVRPEPAKAPPLAGRPLPGFDGIKIDLAADQTKDKMMLVCFWDMEQRPSRYCIRELAKCAEELKENGVTVVAIQVSNVDEDKLNEWVKKYKIPFPVGMVQGDEEKSRFTWGVRALPWLILTDQEHVVRSNGFSLAELDEKIRGAEK